MGWWHARRDDQSGFLGMMTSQQLLIGGAAVIAAGLVAHYAPTMSSAVSPKPMQSVNGFGYLLAQRRKASSISLRRRLPGRRRCKGMSRPARQLFD